jgi:hypothetical protein
MDKTLKKSIRNGSYAFIIMLSFTFFYGGIYNEILTEGLDFTLYNLILIIIGSIFSGLVIGFIPVFIISLIIFYLKDKKKR